MVARASPTGRALCRARKSAERDDIAQGFVILGGMATREGYRWFRGGWRPSAAQRRVLLGAPRGGEARRQAEGEGGEAGERVLTHSQVKPICP